MFVAWGDPFHVHPRDWDRLLMREVAGLVTVCRQIAADNATAARDAARQD